MFEKVNPRHPDKIADRIAGAIVDLAYTKENDPKIAVEVLIGHGECKVVTETSVHFTKKEIYDIIRRIVGHRLIVEYLEVPQDEYLANNQKDKLRCGDNGIFKGVPVTIEQKKLSNIAHILYEMCKHDGKYVIDNNKLIICHSNISSIYLKNYFDTEHVIVNPLGDWTGGTDVDCGATNRKLGSDMGDSITGGGLHGKDLSKADVSVNIYVWLKAQETGSTVELSCAIGDETIDGKPYSEIVEIARKFINIVGGFEKFAEWGLI